MNAIDIEKQVAAAAQAQGLTLDPEQLQRVAAIYARNADIARLVMDFDLPESIETTAIFKP
ncbi:MAG TPA: DUF4089 domain-containing protein [Burkholderiales bacterium]